MLRGISPVWRRAQTVGPIRSQTPAPAVSPVVAALAMAYTHGANRAAPPGAAFEEADMLSAETIKWRIQMEKLREFDLVFWRGTGRVVASGPDTLSLLVRGKRADLTWDRVRSAWQRLAENQALGIDELGGQHDAVGLVSLFAALHQREVEVLPADGLLRVRKTKGKPVRSFPQHMFPYSWELVRRKIDGD
jgi:hypothetical protein